jgi:hypothetical protein
MELLEIQDPEKKKLIENSDRHRRELEREMKSLTEKTERMLTNALIIGGSLALTYFIISQLSKSKSKKKKGQTSNLKEQTNGEAEDRHESVVTPSEPSFISQIGTKVLNQATLILLDIAKEKLAEYLQSRTQRNENS